MLKNAYPDLYKLPVSLAAPVWDLELPVSQEMGKYVNLSWTALCVLVILNDQSIVVSHAAEDVNSVVFFAASVRALRYQCAHTTKSGAKIHVFFCTAVIRYR